MGQYGRHSVIGSNIRHLTYKYNLHSDVVNKAWTQLQHDQCDLGGTGAQSREVCYMRHNSDSTVLDARQIRMMIDAL